MKLSFLLLTVCLAAGTNPNTLARDLFERSPDEGGKRTGTTEDRDRLIAEINTLLERYRLEKGWDTLGGDQLEQARAHAFHEWALDHHSDIRKGPGFESIKNMEINSNLGVVDLDWLATLGSTGPLARGPVGPITYLAGKEYWLTKRAAKPDRTTFSTTYPDTNWRALNTADLLLSGKASVEEVFVPGRETQAVRDRATQLRLQRSMNQPIQAMVKGAAAAVHNLPSAARAEVDGMRALGGVTLAMRVESSSFHAAGDINFDGYVCVSLNSLARAAELELESGHLSDQVVWLGGMTKVVALILDPENGDVVLVGEVIPNRPGVHLDDLVVLLRSAVQGASPFVSLDPRPESVRRVTRVLALMQATDFTEQNLASLLNPVREAIGPQAVVVGGSIPRTSRLARLMVLADYEMKALSQGLIEAPGLLQSSLDRHIATAKQRAGVASSRSSMSRFWFCLPPGQPAFETNSTGVIWLEECSVVVRTECQVAMASGQLADAHTTQDPEAAAFCEEFSRNLQKIGDLHPSIGSLENLFRLQALIKAAFCFGVLRSDELACLIERYPLQNEAPMPDSLPGLANGKVVSWSRSPSPSVVRTFTLAPVVCGGVDMSVKIAPKRFAQTTPKRTELCARALRARPGSLVVAWGLRL